MLARRLPICLRSEQLNMSWAISKVLVVILITLGGGGLGAPPQAFESQQSRRIANNQLVEEFSFLIKDFKVEHQGDNTLNIKVKYRYRANLLTKDYPDFRQIAKDIESFLTTIPMNRIIGRSLIRTLLN